MKIHSEKPGFLSVFIENIFITGDEKPGFFMSVYFCFPDFCYNPMVRFFVRIGSENSK
ncbi:Uncharacterized protein dnm_063840 [Desulfonema magnum]|uniref:Uncharacterized protein n=1 Tax=Desulfonema magnum TaxID=45655 RepID=A0A975BRL7_9BACT|nr:Uncharacterized protein dnm_063840 [Desulfonema magnum]